MGPHRPPPPPQAVDPPLGDLRPGLPEHGVRGSRRHPGRHDPRPLRRNRAGRGQAAGGPIAILRFPEPELPDVVYLEQLTGALYPGEPADIQHYSLAMNRVVVEAAEPAAATAILHRILNEI